MTQSKHPLAIALLATLSGFTAATLSTNAAADNWYIGAEFGAGSYTTSLSSNLDLDKEDSEKKAVNELDSSNYLRLQFGNYINKNLRVYGYMQVGDNTELSYEEYSMGIINIGDDLVQVPVKETVQFDKEDYQLGLGSDYLFHFNDDWSVFAGGNLGYYSSSLKYTYKSNVANLPGMQYSVSKTSKNNGVTAGLNAGVGYNINEQWRLETGAKYSVLVDNDHKIQFEDEYMTYKFKGTSQYYLNASYQF